MDIIDDMTEMDELYNRVEQRVNVESQTAITDFFRKAGTKAVYSASSKQIKLSEEIRDEKERRNKIDRVRTEKALKRIKMESVTSETIKRAEQRLDETRSEKEKEYRQLSKSIFSMSETEIDRLDIDREFLGNTYANSLERAVAQRRAELLEEQKTED